jgi:putative transposase
MVAYIDAHKNVYGVDLICKILPVASSTYYDIKAKQRTPEQRCARARRDEHLQTEIQRVWGENFCVYGVRKVWRQLNREGISVARCTTARLMRNLGLRGVVRGRRMTTTLPSRLAERPLDLVNRDFKVTRPNALWVADLTYVATWRGFVYVAFVMDAFARPVCFATDRSGWPTALPYPLTSRKRWQPSQQHNGNDCSMRLAYRRAAFSALKRRWRIRRLPIGE